MTIEDIIDETQPLSDAEDFILQVAEILIAFLAL